MMKIKLEFALVISWAAVALSQIDFPGNTGTGNNRGQSVVSFLRHENRALTSRQRYGNECRLNRNTVGYCRFIDDEECERPRELMERSRRSRRQRRRARRLLRRRIKSPCGYQDHDYTLCCPGDVPSGPPSNPVIECGKRQEEASNSRRRLQRSPSPTPQDLIPSNFQDSPNTVFIVGGFESADNAWPFTVALGQVNSKDLSFNVVCGGTLISKKHVLTAAHCFPSRPTPAQKITHVRAGKQDLLNPVPIGSFTDASICRTHVHEDFTLIGGAHNDVALVELCQDVTFGQTIQPACLPASQNSKEYQRRTLTVVGWGSESEGGATVDRLREVRFLAEMKNFENVFGSFFIGHATSK